MKGELWQRAKQIFLDAADQPQEKRKSFLDAACGDDDGLRAGVDALLKAEQQADQFLVTEHEEGGAASLEASTDSDRLGEGSGTRIGPYKLLQRIGEGGFGSVWMAEQTEPVVRRVALKIIKLGMDTKQTLARFEAERQALAMMDHPNIARVLDAGATDSGRPYFVMELVKGVSITKYCDTERLGTRDRLDLFMRVCNAVQHAHQKGIIHRDIKPSNVMITLHDGKPVPKVIDFGIAKATSARLTEKTLFTEYGQLIGTPAYMSPEQAEMSGLDIDTRSDIYSLGVLLYELLTGLTPFDAASLREAGYEEMRRIIREEEPPKPSTRLSSAGFGLSEPSEARQAKLPDDAGVARSKNSSIDDIARFRRTDPASLTRQLRGDLDWIVMKCLEKVRSRRYETVNGVASDIQRHLKNQPVEAGPPSAAYRFRKFARRNKAALITTTAIAASLIIGLTLAVYGLITAGHERDQKDAALTKAQQARAESDAVNAFLTDDLLAAVMPSSEPGKGKDVLMREVLDEAAKRIEQASRAGGRFEEMPLVEASIRATLGTTYYLLGDYAAAETHLERASLLRHEELGEEHPDTLGCMNNLALAYSDHARYEEAEPLYVKTLEIRKRNLGEEHPETLSSIENLASLYLRQGHYGEAEPLYVKTLEIRKRVLGEEHPDTLYSMNNLAQLYWKQGRYDEAELPYVTTLEIMKRVLGEAHRDTLYAINNLAILYWKQGRYDEAEPLFLETLAITKRVLGEAHPATLACMNNLAGLYEDQGRNDEAQPLFVKTLKIHKRVLGEEHPSTLSSMNNLAIHYSSQDRHDEAESLYVEALEIMKRVNGEEHPSTLETMNNLAFLYWKQGRYDEAERLYVKALEIMKRDLGDENVNTLIPMSNLAILYKSRGRYDEAEPLFVRTLEIRKRVLGDEHPSTLLSMNDLATYYAEQGRTDDARPLVRAAQEIERRRADRPEASPNDKNGLAWNLLTCEPADLRDPETALRLAREACAMTNNANHAFLDTLALAQHLTGDTPAAIETEKKALSLLPPDAPGRDEYEAALARFEAALKEADAAEEPS